MSLPEFTRERRLRSRSVGGTLALGEAISELLRPPKLVVLRGDLGAGKTTLVKGIAMTLGAAQPDEVLSPTFTLVHEYRGPRVRIVHLDLYRLQDERELEEVGFWEMVEDPEALLLVEWGDRFPSVLARADADVQITPGETETERLFLVRWRER